MKIDQLSKDVVKYAGGESNITDAANCMTRLRLTVLDSDKVDVSKLENTDGVMAVIHDKDNYYEVVVGPGVCKQAADFINKNMSIGGDAKSDSADKDNKEMSAGDWKDNKAKIKGKQKSNWLKNSLKVLGEIFVPLIPGVMCAGLSAGFAILLTQIWPDYKDNAVLYCIFQFLTLVKLSFMTYITAWAGYRAAERFGGTPILGGMIGMVTTLSNIADIAKIVGLDAAGPIGEVLSVGRGGVIAALVGAWLVAKVELWLHSKVHPNVDIIVTPLLSIFIVVVPYVLIIMPVAGFVSTGIAWVVEKATLNENVFIRMIAGFCSAALFLPLVAMGMHHSLIAVYTVQLNTIGFVTLYPALCMGGFGQIGAAIAIYQIAKNVNNQRLCRVITGAIPAGVLGVGEPLIYGVTLPLGRPFFTAGLGAGFGGAIVMAATCASTTWGPSGLMGVFVITAGPLGAFMSIVVYLIGGVVSLVLAYLISRVGLDKQAIEEFN